MIPDRRRYRKPILAFLLIAGILAAGCAAEADAPLKNGAEDPSAEAARDLEVTEDEALAGDQLAAAYLQAVYSKTDQDLYLYWLKIGAENGHSISQYNLAFELWAHGNSLEDDQIRAKFWLGRAAAAGDSEATAVLARLNDGGEW
jgi:TPR repeat protein